MLIFDLHYRTPKPYFNILFQNFSQKLRNTRSNLSATDHTYVHRYGRFLSFDMFLKAQMHLKSKQTLYIARP